MKLYFQSMIYYSQLIGAIVRLLQSAAQHHVSQHIPIGHLRVGEIPHGNNLPYGDTKRPL